MKIKNEKTKTLVIISGIFALFIGVVLVPYGFRDASLQRRIDQARTKLGIDSVDNAGLVRLYEEVKQRRAKLDSGGKYIPDKDGISRVIKDFSSLINAEGVSGQEIITVEAKEFADYNILPVKIQFNATFTTAYDLIERIERLSSVVRIDRLDIESDDNYPNEPLTVNMELSAFYTTEEIGGGI